MGDKAIICGERENIHWDGLFEIAKVDEKLKKVIRMELRR